jgi:hypothetical protein
MLTWTMSWSGILSKPGFLFCARQGDALNLDTRRTMEAEITDHAERSSSAMPQRASLFYACVSSSMMHMPVLPNPAFVGKTGNGDWADCLAEMDYRTSQILDAIKQAGIENDTLVNFASDNGREPIHGKATAVPGEALTKIASVLDPNAAVANSNLDSMVLSQRRGADGHAGARNAWRDTRW